MSILHLLKQEHYHLGQQKNGRDVFVKTKPSPSCTKPKKADRSSLKKTVECRPLDEAKALVEDPDRLILEIPAILEANKHTHCLTKW